MSADAISDDSAVTSKGRVVLIMPAFKEATSLPGLLGELRGMEIADEIVVIDDGSPDETAATAERCGATVLRHPFNMGYGAALQTGYKHALAGGAEYLVQMDADGQHLPSTLADLLDQVKQGHCDLCVGSRFLVPADYQMGPLRSAGRWLFSRLARIGGLTVSDPTSGLQAMNRRVLELFTTDLYPVDYPDVDVLLLVHRRGLKIAERPVQMAQSWRPSTMHSGLAPLYYCYRLLLALWALGGVPRGPRPDSQ